MVALSIASAVSTDTSPQELLAMAPREAVAAVLVPNLKFCSDEITRCLEGMDRANLLLGTRPLDQVKTRTGFNVGINDVGGAAIFVLPSAPDGQPRIATLIPVNDGPAFLKANFSDRTEDDRCTTATGQVYFAKAVKSYVVVSESFESMRAIIDAASASDVESPWTGLGEQADRTMAEGELLFIGRSAAARQALNQLDLFFIHDADRRHEQIAESIMPMVDDLQVGIVAVNFDPLAVVIKSMAIFPSESKTAKILSGGTPSATAPLSRLPNKPGYCALSIDIGGLGGAAAFTQLADRLGLPSLPQSLAHAETIQFSAHPSPAGLAGGFLNDASLIATTDSPLEIRSQLKEGLTALTKSQSIQCEMNWMDDKAVKNAAAPLTADHYEVRFISMPPELAMLQTAIPYVFGRAGWRGFVTTTDDAMIMTFSQRPAVLEAALNTKPEASLGSSGMVRTMHTWMPPRSDLQMYLGLAQLANTARQIAESFGAAGELKQFDLDAGSPPLGLALEVDAGSFQSVTVVPSALLAIVIDHWIGAMKGGAANDHDHEPVPASGERQ